MEEIIIQSGKTSESGSGKLQTVTVGKRFFDYVQSLEKILDTDEKRTRYRKETVDILSHCNPHNATDRQQTTHLVVGYVQSGKTMSFTGLSALALDNGYRIIVYLAGTKNNLLEQTSKRLKKDLISVRPKNSSVYKIRENPTEKNIDDIVGPLKLSDKPIVLIPILKHYDHIQKLTDVFNSVKFKNEMRSETVIIIDDEADQASLNSFGRKNSRSADDEEYSRTYESILAMRASLPGNTYIQYTATPQANILISMCDLLSPQSHTLLTPGDGYVGGKLFFGRGENHDLFNGQLIVEIPKGEVFYKKNNPLTSMPKSLKKALMLHVLAVALVVKYDEDSDISFLSMMVHPDNQKKWNSEFKKWIDNEFEHWSRACDQPDGCDDKEHLYQEFEQYYPEAVKLYDEDKRPPFEKIKILLRDIINDKKVYLVNTDKDAEVDIDWSAYPMHILVGAEMLNRGFTVENLATTYMPRYTDGVANADTIQQRCRFFGYKMKYIKSCRVFLPQQNIRNYYSYIAHEEELRSMLATCDTLSEVERKMLLSPNLRPTRNNVLPISVVNRNLKGLHESSAYTAPAMITSNTNHVQDFLSKHESDFIIDKIYDTPVRCHRYLRVSVDEAIEFLSGFHFGNCEDAVRKSDTIRYLKFISEQDTESIKHICIYQIGYKASAKRREIVFKDNKYSITTNVFTGPSNANDKSDYPGDRKFVDDDTITIQIHYLELVGLPVSFPKNAYTLAINYPQKLAIRYCANSAVNNVDWDDEED